jgi:hypothetical protein
MDFLRKSNEYGPTLSGNVLALVLRASAYKAEDVVDARLFSANADVNELKKWADEILS